MKKKPVLKNARAGKPVSKSKKGEKTSKLKKAAKPASSKSTNSAKSPAQGKGVKAAKAAQVAAQVKEKEVAEKVAKTRLKLTRAASTQDLAKAAAKIQGAEPQSPIAIAAAQAAPSPSPSVVRPRVKQGPKLCHESGCDSEPVVGNYCRAHYIRNWRKIKRKEVILKERKLNQYVEELINKYPEKYIEAIQQDLANDRDFSKVVHDLELNLAIEDEDGESETIDTLLGNIRKDIDVSGGSPGGSAIEDDEDLF